LNVTNLKAMNYTKVGDVFTLSILGIINPNQKPILSSGIKFFLMNSEIDVANYTNSIGGLTFTNPPSGLKIVTFIASSNKTRVLTDYNFLFQTYSGAITGPSTIMVQFPPNFKLKYMN